MARTDWVFDVFEHIIDHYGEKIDFTPDEVQHYDDRVTGTVAESHNMADHEFRAVIVPRAVGFENADRFRRWVTVDKTHWAAMTARPAGWRVFILMIGLLPDGNPWWSALYEEHTLAELRDHSEQMAGFYRFDPGLTSKALISDWDKDRTDTGRPPVIYEADNANGGSVHSDDAADLIATLWDWAARQPADDPLVGRIDITADRMKVTVG